MTQKDLKPLVSLVVPVFNEEANIQPFYEAVLGVTDTLEESYRFEFVFTDNHSADGTFGLLKDLTEKDSRVHAYRFSRNFGFQRSIILPDWMKLPCQLCYQENEGVSSLLRLTARDRRGARSWGRGLL